MMSFFWVVRIGTLFHGELKYYGVYRCRESQGWTTACSSMPERDGKDQGEDSPKQVGSSWFARHSSLATSGTNLYAPGVWCADVMSSFSGDRLFCFVSFLPFCFH